ncbi:glycoside hydrolase family 127 protein [Streptomyces niveiscabiei]|uniref:Beta-L-arabinofuranosidase domain-containing protein n=1 Tax=Streptomyces niveiscabiei TaxID=164115 RepID=A0ABW9HP79_9ACTN
MDRYPFGRRQVLALGGATALALGAGPTAARAASGKAGDGAVGGSEVGGGGSVRPFPLDAVALLDSPFRANQQRNTAYLRFVDIDRLLHTFRLNVGLHSAAEPCGGWEAPDQELRGHSTGHLLSGLALTYANTGDEELRAKGRALVAALAECQAASPKAGFGKGYLSAFPEELFDRLEKAEEWVWAPYYTLHKIMAGLVDQYRLAGNGQALDVVLGMAGWLDRRTGRLSYEEMQQALWAEFGGIQETLADLHALTGDGRWLTVAERFADAEVYGPLARNEDRLAGLHANTQIPKATGALRMWEEGLEERYRAIAENFWRIVVGHHTYVIGGNSSRESFGPPDAIAGRIGELTCENCNSYNMLKLTRLLHFHAPERTELLDHYERTLFNQMLGEQDPDSAHGFNIYYTDLNPMAFKQQPWFMGEDENAYSTDYGNFSCDHGTGMETQAKFADTVYAHDEQRLLVNLFIPSEVTWREKGITWRQTTRFPDESATTLTVASGRAAHRLQIRVPAWASGARATLNGRPLPHRPRPGGWLVLDRLWCAGDRVELSLPMRTVAEPAPDDPDVRALVHGPIVLAGAYGDTLNWWLPRLELGSVRQESADPLRFTARADGKDVTLLPVARVHHQRYSVYWITGELPAPPPAFAVHHRFDETSGTVAGDATGNGKTARLAGGASWSPSGVVLDGKDGYVRLADDLLAGASAYTVAVRVRLDAQPEPGARVFDIGTGETAYLFLTPRTDDGKLRFAVSTLGASGEQQVDADALAVGRWAHVAVTYAERALVLYVDGKEVGRDAKAYSEPRYFANHIRGAYLGRSQYGTAPYLKGTLGDFRVYGRALSAQEVAGLAGA